MSPFVLKLILTPLLILAVTLAARRWGPVVGGLLVGLPLTSGPVSVFLAFEQGRVFAANAAQGTLLGVMAVVAFCVSYARCSQKFHWPVAATLSLACYCAIAAAFSTVSPSLFVTACATLSVIFLATFAVKPLSATIPPPAAPVWDLPFRILAATAVVAAITAASTNLGPRLSGLLSTFPIFICVMSIFSHFLNGPAAVHQFLRGVVIGSFSFTAFFLVVCLTVKTMSLPTVYLGATGTALGVNFAIFKLFVQNRPLKTKAA